MSQENEIENKSVSVDRRIKALEFFKDWTNYLLVTTVAALGWVTKPGLDFSPPGLKLACIWCLSASIVFAILTLALIPHISEQMKEDEKSIYKVKASFYIFGIQCRSRLKNACFPQHVLFLAGVIIYSIGVV